MFDGKAFGDGIVEIVRGYVEREIAPLKAENAELKARIADLEARPTPEKGEPGEKGEDGLSPEPKTIAEAFVPLAEQIIAEAVVKAVAELPPAESGPPGEKGDKGDNGADGSNGADGKDGLDGKDAAGIVEALKDSGELVLTLADGRLVRTGVRDGEKGADGKDGFGFDDMDVCVLDDDRTIELSFKRGEDEKAFTLKWPTVIDRGPFKIDRELPYEAGDGCTWGGQFFICNEQTNDKPDLSKDGKPWRLAVRKGRDGKDARG